MNKKRNISKLIFGILLISFLFLVMFVHAVLATDTLSSVSSVNNLETTHVNINCRSDSQCGKTGPIDSKFCLDNAVYQFSQSAVCQNPKTTESFCQIQKTSQILQDCGPNTCSDYGKRFCKENSVYQTNTCTLRGCKSGSCFSKNYKEEILVEVCPNGCKNGECKIACNDDDDCGKTGYFGKEFCSNDNVFKNHQNWICKHPGTPRSSCELKTDSKMILDCGVSSCFMTGEKFCIKNILYQNQICTIKGCDSGACFARSSSPQVVLIKECLRNQTCINGECICNPKLAISYSNWKNISCINNVLNQSRIKTIYDSHCGKVANSTIIEYRSFCNSCNTAYSPNWQCTPWSFCFNGYQNRTCTDINNCNNLAGKPTESQSCSSRSCIPFWDCSDWSSCSEGTRQRTCTDLYYCGTDFGKPDESEDCSSHYLSSDYGTVAYSYNNVVQNGVEKEPIISIGESNQTQDIVHLEPKINSPAQASILGLSTNSNIFITLFIVAIILFILLIVLAIIFRR